jgi:Leucine-rich repeat (LRR) protein
MKISRTLLSGTLPATIGSLAKLEVLKLDGNRLSGSIPTEFGNMLKLRQVDLQFNSLEGPLPAFTSVEPGELQLLNLSGNDFTGILSTHITSS